MQGRAPRRADLAEARRPPRRWRKAFSSGVRAKSSQPARAARRRCRRPLQSRSLVGQLGQSLFRRSAAAGVFSDEGGLVGQFQRRLGPRLRRTAWRRQPVRASSSGPRAPGAASAELAARGRSSVGPTDLVGVEVGQLVPVQPGRRARHVLEVEPGRGLLVGEHFVVAVAPAQLGQSSCAWPRAGSPYRRTRAPPGPRAAWTAWRPSGPWISGMWAKVGGSQPRAS